MTLVTGSYFSLVVLCYRSGRSLVPFVERLRHVLSRCNFTWELVLVGNYIEGSEDETPQVVRELAERWPDVSAVVRPKEGMMGWDMRMGLMPRAANTSASSMATGSFRSRLLSRVS